MEYKDFNDLTDSDTWVTDGNSESIVLKGKEAIMTFDEPMFFVSAETLPDDFFN